MEKLFHNIKKYIVLYYNMNSINIKPPSYCKKITQCNVNAQLWYMTKAIKSVKKNQNVNSRQYAVANYYLNGNAKVILAPIVK